MRVLAWAHRCFSVLFLLVVAVVLCAPGALQYAGYDLHFMPTADDFRENRVLAEEPSPPNSLSELLTYPVRLEPFLTDHLSFRADLITVDALVRYEVFGQFTTQQVIAGRHGRIMLTSHNASRPFDLIHTVCGFGVTPQWVQIAAAANDALLHNLRRYADTVLLVFAPSATALYPQDLPAWLERQCAVSTPAVSQVAAAMSDRDRQDVAYPKPPDIDGPVVPIANLHWQGAGVQAAIQEVAETKLHAHRWVTVPMVSGEMTSDLWAFTPGLVFKEKVTFPDWAAAGITKCAGPKCFPELGAIGDIIVDMSTYRGPARGGRVLMLSDSFGAMSAGYLAEYFTEVRHVSMNALERLSKDQIATLRHQLLEVYRPDVIIILAHDGASLYNSNRLNMLLLK